MQIKKISDYLSEELCNKYYSVRETQAGEVDTIIDLIEYISQNRKVNKDRKTTVDPEYKIYKRFKNFTDKLITEYTTLYTIYGEALNIVNETLGIDEAQDIIIMFYLQDISVQFLEEEHDNPIAALNKLVTYFEEKLSTNGKKYDRSAIKFYLVNEMIKWVNDEKKWSDVFVAKPYDYLSLIIDKKVPFYDKANGVWCAMTGGTQTHEEKINQDDLSESNKKIEEARNTVLTAANANASTTSVVDDLPF